MLRPQQRVEMPTPILIGNGNAHPAYATAASSFVKASTSVKMSDGSTLPLSFRPAAFPRLNGVSGLGTPNMLHTLLPSPALLSSPGSSMMIATPPAQVDLGFSLSPAAGFHPASYKGPGSFGASHLANMESSFCKNFVCCGLELDDLHGLLEHFEERHCQGGDIIGVEGFEGVTLSQIAEGVGASKDTGYGPGMGNEPLPPGVGKGGFEGEEEWSSEGTHSEPSSPQTRHAINFPSRISGSRQAPSTVSNSPSPPTGTVDPAGLIMGNRKPFGYREGISCRTTPASSVPGTPHINEDDMDDSSSQPAAGPSNDTLAALLRNFSVGRPFSLTGVDTNANTIGHVGVPPSLLQGEAFGHPSMHQATGPHIGPMNAAGLVGLPGQLSSGLVDPRLPFKKRSNLDPVTGLTPTGRQPRPWVPPSEKPFKCSVPGCDKAYKQQNGLKYHRTHGHCSQGLTPEEEAKPFVCHHEVCSKRYKNMNGLRYHYQHSGQHGMVGIQLLALGAHPLPQYPAGHKKLSLSSSTTTTPLGSRSCSPTRAVSNTPVNPPTPRLGGQITPVQSVNPFFFSPAVLGGTSTSSHSINTASSNNTIGTATTPTAIPSTIIPATLRGLLS